MTGTEIVLAAGTAVEVLPPVVLKAPSVLLMGGIGSGKTSTIESILKAGLEVFYIALEPGYEDVFGKFAGGMPSSSRLHWHYIPPVQDDMKITLDKVQLIMDNDDKTIKGMGGINKKRHTQLLDFLRLCNDYVDQRTGEHFGDFASWGPNRCLFIDGLSGLTTMAVKVKIGDKPYLEQNDYYAVQSMIEDIVTTIVSNSKALFVLAAHQEWEANPTTGLNQLMASTAGKALAPRLPRPFSDAIVTKRTVDSNGNVGFYWDNIDPTATVKWRNLPPKSKHDPSFGPLMDNWRKKVDYSEAKPAPGA